MKTYRKIYQRIAELSHAALTPSVWSFLDCPAGVREYPGSAVDLLAALRENFSENDLVDAKVALRTDDGALGPAPKLIVEPLQFQTLQTDAANRPFELLTTQGGLRSANPPLFDALRDELTAAHFECEPEKLLLATFSFDDLAILREIPVAASLAVGLDSLDGRQLRKLFGPHDPGDENGRCVVHDDLAHVARHYATIVLVGWQVAELLNQTPEGFEPTVEHLGRAYDDFGFLDIERNMRVWRPLQDELDKMRFAAELRDRQLFQISMQESLSCSTVNLVDYYAARPEPKTSQERYLRAERDLIGALQRANRLRSQASLIPPQLTQFHDAYVRTYVEPLREQATSPADALDRALYEEAAELTEQLFFTKGLVVAAQQGREYLPDGPEIDPSQQKHHLANIDRLLAIRKELSHKERPAK